MIFWFFFLIYFYFFPQNFSLILIKVFNKTSSTVLAAGSRLATRQDASLREIISSLHTFMKPPTVAPPLQVVKSAKGVNGDHSGLILALKASKDFIVRQEKRTAQVWPLPEPKMNLFSLEMTQHKWTDVLDTAIIDNKPDNFHKYWQKLFDKRFSFL